MIKLEDNTLLVPHGLSFQLVSLHSLAERILKCFLDVKALLIYHIPLSIVLFTFLINVNVNTAKALIADLIYCLDKKKNGP